ncbi:acriflavin resistance protein [Oleiphilus sp. HI0009]|nr:acriflavin resistance protein [Oleiphilus sp. HI0009]
MALDTGKHKHDLIGRFAQHRVAANLLMLILLIAGAVSLLKLNTQFLPSFQPDYITVRVIWPGASAEDVAKSIVTPLEQELRDLDYVKEMKSTSYQASAVISLEYDEGTDMGLALDQVKEQVSLVRNLPSDAEEPEISKVVINEDVATLILSADASRDELRPLAYDFERELIARGISKVELIGLPAQEIAITVSTQDINRIGESIPSLGRSITSASQDIPAGTSAKDEVARELRSIEQRRDQESFKDLVVLTAKNGERLRLGEFAEVERRNKEKQVEVFYKHRPAVLMRILRTPSSDTLQAAEIFNTWLKETSESLPPTVYLDSYNEAYVLIEDRINLLVKNGIGGLILVVAILFIFLNGRVAFWVTIGIPVSFAGTLAVMYAMGGTINMVSMFALIMALGIIVDDAIVVGEDALTHFQKGEGALQAAEGGARRMFVPVMSSSLTTISAFLPLIIISGIIGNILFAIPLVIICVIIASLIECFLIMPGHLNHSLKKMGHNAKESRFRVAVDSKFNAFRDGTFRQLATKAIQNRGTTLMLAVSVFLISITLIISGRIQFEFFPQPENHVLLGNAKFAAGTPPEEVRSFARNLEDALWRANDQLKEKYNREDDLIVHAVLRVNQATFDGGQSYQQGEQYASLHVETVTPDSREVRNPELISAWKDALQMPDGVEQLSITSPRGGPPGKDIDIFLTGQSSDILKAASEELQDALKGYVGVNDIQDDIPYGKSQFIYELTTQGESLGLSVSDVGNQLRAGFDGQLLQVFYDQNEEVEVRILLPDQERNTSRTLNGFPIVTAIGDIVRLDNVVSLSSRKGLELVRHTDGRFGLRVTAGVDASLNNANVVLDDVSEQFLPELAARYGLDYELKGRAEEQRQTGAEMMLGASIGITLIYIILAWVFGSYSWPLAVILAIPLGISGAILGHWLLGINLTMLSWFGFFGLSGIVINDAIILVTFYRELREQGQAIQEAIINATCLRLRAVMLTSLTTIAGLLPLLFETSLQAQFLIPMAVSISFGLAYATVLILFVIPALVSKIEEMREKRAGKRKQPELSTI